MTTAIANDIDHARELIESGSCEKVELAFEIDSDAFFNFAVEYCGEGAKLSRHNNHFVVKLPELGIPANT